MAEKSRCVGTTTVLAATICSYIKFRLVLQGLFKKSGEIKSLVGFLGGRLPGGKVIYASYKGQDYKAWVRTNGGIRFNGRTYDSPSGAGKAIRKKETDGWRFWKYKDKEGNLVRLKNLRK